MRPAGANNQPSTTYRVKLEPDILQPGGESTDGASEVDSDHGRPGLLLGGLAVREPADYRRRDLLPPADARWRAIQGHDHMAIRGHSLRLARGSGDRVEAAGQVSFALPRERDGGGRTALRGSSDRRSCGFLPGSQSPAFISQSKRPRRIRE